MQIVSDKLNEATARLDKYKWLQEEENKIKSSVYQQLKLDLDSMIKEGIREGFSNSKDNSLTPVV